VAMHTLSYTPRLHALPSTSLSHGGGALLSHMSLMLIGLWSLESQPKTSRDIQHYHCPHPTGKTLGMVANLCSHWKGAKAIQQSLLSLLCSGWKCLNHQIKKQDP
jgi:hypothetical protein